MPIQFDRYQAQVTMLTSMLRPVYGPTLEIGTVDGMQGREKDAIVISLVRSNQKVCLSVSCIYLFLREFTLLHDIERSRLSQRQAKVEW